MGSLLELLDVWEIQLLVLVSFILQVFLFFTGSLRKRSTNGLLRGTIWLAYLGADLVAIYALGYLSRHVDTTVKKGYSTLGESHPLVFLWAPFLLIHLGGQDTITAFSIEDNNLWLRHLLNLVVQVTLSLYVFLKSTSWHNNVQLLVPGILLFAAGIIKYGERTVALMRALVDYKSENFVPELDPSMVPKVLDIELSLMYDDMYTKGALLQKRSAIVTRCISQVCIIAALVIFAVMSNKQAPGISHSSVDVGITYMLFIGSILLDVCALFTVLLASPWTWWWLEDRGYHRLAHISWSLVGRPESRPLWSNKMGQYCFLSYLGSYNEPVTVSQRVVGMMRKIARAVGVESQEINWKLFWVSKLVDTRYETVDKEVMKCVVDEILSLTSSRQFRQKYRHMGPFINWLSGMGSQLGGFAFSIKLLHVITNTYLMKVSEASSSSITALAKVCQKLSNYMMYLVSVDKDVSTLLQRGIMNTRFFWTILDDITVNSMDFSPDDLIEKLRYGDAGKVFPWMEEQNEEALEELRDVWVRLLIYAASKSRREAHAAQLARGGELLTFVWLLMQHRGIGDGMPLRLDLSAAPSGDDPIFKVINLFDL
uniref:DUF4220 domain-containing protein n=1 Tax=Oryza brachyantha TaxID=4533 RepID=J3MR92_ORYBR